MTPGRPPTRVRTSFWIWARSGQPAVVRAMVTVTRPSSATWRPGHAEVDDVAAQLRVDDPAQQLPSTSSGEGGAETRLGPRGAFYRTRRVISRGDRSGSTGRGREVAARVGSRRRRWPTADRVRLDVLKALGDNTRYAIYLELARSPMPAVHRRGGRGASTCTPTPCGPTSSACATSACSRSQTDARGGVGPAPAPLLPRPRRPVARPRAARVPALARLLLRRGRRAPAPAPRRRPSRPGPGRADGRRLRRRRLRRGARRASWPSSASTRRWRATATAPPSPSPTARSATWPRPHPDLVCHLHRGLVEGFVEEWAGGRRPVRLPRRPRPLPGRRWSAGLDLDADARTPERRSPRLAAVPGCTGARRLHEELDVIALTDTAAKVKELIAAEGDDEPGAAGRRAARRLLGLQLRDVLRHRDRRRRPDRRATAGSRSSSTPPSAQMLTGATPRLQGRAPRRPGSRSTTPTPSAPAAAAQSFS